MASIKREWPRQSPSGPDKFRVASAKSEWPRQSQSYADDGVRVASVKVQTGPRCTSDGMAIMLPLRSKVTLPSHSLGVLCEQAIEHGDCSPNTSARPDNRKANVPS